MRHKQRPLMILDRLALVVGLCLPAIHCIVPGPALAADATEKWQATSTTAISVTGNITFAPNRIQFQNGQSLPLAVVSHVTDFKAMGDNVAATIYRVTAPADLRLKNGNHLCGGGGHSQPVTYIVIWKPEAPPDEKPRSMAAFSGKEPPHSSGDASSCGIYNYDSDR